MLVTPNYDDGIKPGVYEARLKDAFVKNSKAGNKYIGWVFVINPNTASGTEQGGEEVFHNTMLEGKMAFMTRRVVKCFKSDYEEGPFETMDFIDKKLMITLDRNYMPDGSISMYPKVVEVSPLVKSDIPF